VSVAAKDSAAARTQQHSGMATTTAATSFEETALPHLDTLYRVALRLTRDPARAEDLVQDAMLRAFRAWDRFEPGTNARAWLVTILRNIFINDYRRSRREPAAVQLDAIEPRLFFHDLAERDPEGEFFNELIDERILAAVDALPTEFREAVVLSDMEGMSYAEIAQALGVPIGTVKSRLFRGRRLLQHALYDYAVEAGYLKQPEDGA
jgi:RNA polymerase sigma-70 factor (ECF subfamily)